MKKFRMFISPLVREIAAKQRVMGNKNRQLLKKQQNGMILATVLILLLILSILAVSAMSSSRLQARMSYNLSDDIRVLQAAEAGLQIAEKTLTDGEMQFDKISVTYKLRNLTEKRCVLDQSGNKSMGNYFSIISEASWNGEGKISLQSIYIQPSIKPCSATAKPIQAGRISWRQYG